MEKNYIPSKNDLYRDIKKAISEKDVLDLREQLNKIHKQIYHGSKNN
jgi:hypothetical protein